MELAGRRPYRGVGETVSQLSEVVAHLLCYEALAGVDDARPGCDALAAAAKVLATDVARDVTAECVELCRPEPAEWLERRPLALEPLERQGRLSPAPPPARSRRR
jgi:hypothetical protein